MNKITFYFFIWSMAISCADKSNDQGAESEIIAITNVTLIDGTGSPAQENVSILIKDGRILNIVEGSINAEVDSIIDGQDKYIIPGLFDAHFHFPYERERALKQLIHFGITSVLNTGSSHTSYDMLKEFIRREKTDSIVSPHIYYTSYYVTIPGAHPAKNVNNETGIVTGNISVTANKNIYFIKSEEDISKFVNDAKKGGAYAMKVIIEDGPTPPLVDRISQGYVDRLVTEAKKQDMKVYAHISDTIELQMGLAAGVDGFVHSIISKHFWGTTNKDLIAQMIQDSVPMMTTNMIIKSSLYPFNSYWKKEKGWEIYEEDQLSAIEEMEPVFKESVEPMLRYYMGFSDFSMEELKPIMENFRLLYDSGVPIVVGTDVGALAYILPGHSLHEELQMLQLGGMEPIDIIKCATLNAAKLLSVDQDYGSIEEGKVADFVILSENPIKDISNTLSIEAVFKRGKKQPRITNTNNL